MGAIAFVVAVLASVPVRIDVRPGPAETFTATVAVSSGATRGGAFTGDLALNGSPAALPVSARAEAVRGGLRLPLTLRYADIPQDWANRYRPGTFDWRMHGRVAGAPVAWSGTVRWDDVGFIDDRDVVERFVRLVTLEVTDVSLVSSEARAVLGVRNPFSFPLTLASTRYRLTAGARLLGQGATRGVLLRPRRESTVLLPIEVEHGALIAAAGGAVLSSDGVPARLAGTLTVRLPRGDVPVPIDVSGRLSVR